MNLSYLLSKYEKLGQNEVGQNIGALGIRLWDLATQKERAVLWHTNINAALFSPDGKVLLTRGYDQKEKLGMIRSWDVNRRRL